MSIVWVRFLKRHPSTVMTYRMLLSFMVVGDGYTSYDGGVGDIESVLSVFTIDEVSIYEKIGG